MKENKILLFYNKEPLSFIKDFEETKKGTFIKLKSSLNGIDDVDLSCDKKEFRVKFDFNKFYKGERNLGIGQQIERIKFNYGERIIVFKSLYIDTFSNESLEASINQLYSEGFSKSKKQYFKLVIPSSGSLKMHFQIENILFLNDSGTNSSLATKINLNDEEIFILEDKDEFKNRCIIIESKKKQTYEEFSNKTFAIRVGSRLCDGLLPGK